MPNTYILILFGNSDQEFQRNPRDFSYDLSEFPESICIGHLFGDTISTACTRIIHSPVRLMFTVEARPSWEQYEEIRERIDEQHFACDKARQWKPDMSWEKESDIKREDQNWIWTMDKPNVPRIRRLRDDNEYYKLEQKEAQNLLEKMGLTSSSIIMLNKI